MVFEYLLERELMLHGLVVVQVVKGAEVQELERLKGHAVRELRYLAVVVLTE